MNDVSLILTGNTKRVKLFLTTLKAMLKISKHRAWSHWKLFQAFHTWLTAFFKVFCIEISISRLNVTFDIALTHLAYVLLIFHNKYIKSHGFLDGNAWSSFLCGQTLKCGAQNILSYGWCLTDSRMLLLMPICSTITQLVPARHRGDRCPSWQITIT